MKHHNLTLSESISRLEDDLKSVAPGTPRAVAREMSRILALLKQLERDIAQYRRAVAEGR